MANTQHKRNRLILIGAGPGDPDLITVKAQRYLEQAQVVLYDALVDRRLIDALPRTTIAIPVGKRGGQPSMTQDEINQLIVSYAYAYGEVIRLKGGDPFIFGRGSEEWQFAASFGIEVTVVPGISSSTGLTGLSGIPLTHRGISEGFVVMTATLKQGSFNTRIRQILKNRLTLVLLMGISKLPQIIRSLKRSGNTDIPIAIIQNGSLPNERLVVGTARDIEERVQETGIGSPAIIVIGETVGWNRPVRNDFNKKYHAYAYN